MERVWLFVYMILFPGVALFGTVYALAGFSRLSIRREWLHLPAAEWRRAKLYLALFLLGYPGYWLLSPQLWSVQEVAIPAFTVTMGLIGAILGRGWSAMARRQPFKSR